MRRLPIAGFWFRSRRIPCSPAASEARGESAWSDPWRREGRASGRGGRGVAGKDAGVWFGCGKETSELEGQSNSRCGIAPACLWRCMRLDVSRSRRIILSFVLRFICFHVALKATKISCSFGQPVRAEFLLTSPHSKSDSGRRPPFKNLRFHANLAHFPHMWWRYPFQATPC